MWKNIIINRNLIKAATDRAVLIAMPHNSDYDGYSFWHPSKLVREYNNTVSIGYTYEFVFLLKKYGKGIYNRWNVLDEIPLSGEDMGSVFADLNGNFIPPDDEPLIYTPEHRNPENSTADESLIDYD